MTNVLNASVADGRLTAAIVDFATALGARRLGSASTKGDVAGRRLSMSAASVLSVSVNTFSPTPAPSPLPSMAPTPMPTIPPTSAPTFTPTLQPSATPTPAPSPAPLAAPTLVPIPAPTTLLIPVPTSVPIPAPTAVPTPAPTFVSIPPPTAVPIPAPTAVPSPVPPPLPTLLTCTNDVMDASETDVDCGGGDCPRCSVGLACAESNDCSSVACVSNVCVDSPTPVPTPVPSSVLMPVPTLVPTGAPMPVPSAVPTAVTVPSSTATPIPSPTAVLIPSPTVVPPPATTSVPLPPPTSAPMLAPTPIPTAASCEDGNLDGLETDVDCGGGNCPRCGVGENCTVDNDCHSFACVDTACVPMPTAMPISLPTVVPILSPTAVSTSCLTAAPNPTPTAIPVPATAPPTFAPTTFAPTTGDTVTIRSSLTMSGINAADFGDDEVSAFKTTVAAVLHGVEEEHVSNIVVEDGRRRQLLSGGCTISYDIQLSLSETSFSSAEYFASDLDEQISSSVSTGLFTAMLVATAGSTSALALATATAVVSVLATRSPTAVPPTVMPTFAPGGEQAVDRQWFVATGWKLWIALAALVIPTCYCFCLVHARTPGGSDKKSKVLPTETEFSDVEAVIKRDADDAEEETTIQHNAASRRYAPGGSDKKNKVLPTETGFSDVEAVIERDADDAEEETTIKHNAASRRYAPGGSDKKNKVLPTETGFSDVEAVIKRDADGAEEETTIKHNAASRRYAASPLVAAVTTDQELKCIKLAPEPVKKVAAPAVTMDVATTVISPTVASYKAETLQAAKDDARLLRFHKEDERQASGQDMQRGEAEPAVPVDVAITVNMLPTIARYEADALQKAKDKRPRLTKKSRRCRWMSPLRSICFRRERDMRPTHCIKMMVTLA